jgi:hypothetical protein
VANKLSTTKKKHKEILSLMFNWFSDHELAVLGGQAGALTMDFVDVLDLETGLQNCLYKALFVQSQKLV